MRKWEVQLQFEDGWRTQLYVYEENPDLGRVWCNHYCNEEGLNTRLLEVNVVGWSSIKSIAYERFADEAVDEWFAYSFPEDDEENDEVLEGVLWQTEGF